MLQRPPPGATEGLSPADATEGPSPADATEGLSPADATEGPSPAAGTQSRSPAGAAESPSSPGEAPPERESAVARTDSGAGASGRALVLARRIEREIREGGIASGTRLGTKRELCERYAVSYGTMNEAIRVLQHRGFLHTVGGPRGGLFASTPTAHVKLAYLSLGYDAGGTFDECAAVRFALEEAVVLDAAASRTDDDVDDLERLYGEMQRCAEHAGQYVRANWALHRRIARTCANRVLRNLYCTLLDANEAQLRDVVPDRGFAHDVVTNLAAHRSLIDAIAAGSADAAKRAAEAHAAARDPASST